MCVRACVQTGDLVICRLRRHSKSLPNHTLDQTTNMSNQISKESDQIGEYSLSIQNQNIDMPDQIGEYWLDF